MPVVLFCGNKVQPGIWNRISCTAPGDMRGWEYCYFSKFPSLTPNVDIYPQDSNLKGRLLYSIKGCRG